MEALWSLSLREAIWGILVAIPQGRFSNHPYHHVYYKRIGAFCSILPLGRPFGSHTLRCFSAHIFMLAIQALVCVFQHIASMIRNLVGEYDNQG